MKIQNVTVAGGGVLGSQIAYQCAYAGFHVTTYLRSEASVQRAQPKIARLHKIYQAELTAAKEHGGAVSRGLIFNGDAATADYDTLLRHADEAFEHFHYETDLTAAVADADLVIEALAEQPEAKKAFFAQLQPLLPEKTIIATNSSTLLPSVLADSTGRPGKFLSLHFANNIWKQNIAEVMGHPGTDPQAYEAVAEFAGSMGMIPMKLKKEKVGYILNRCTLWPLPNPRYRGHHHRLQYHYELPGRHRSRLPPRQAGQDAEGGLPGSGQNRHQRRRRLLFLPINRAKIPLHRS